MPGLSGSRFLSSVMINEIIRDLANQLETGRPLVYLARTPEVPAEENEIMGRFRARPRAADIIVPGQAAAVYASGSFEVYSTTIPNIKLGRSYGENDLIKLHQWEIAPVRGENAFLDWQLNTANQLLEDIRTRQNAMICAMQMDAYTYDRFGVKIEGANWGMPSDLKVTPSVYWTDAANAKPIDDILNMVIYATNKYGVVYNRLTMGLKTLQLIFATTQFQQRAQALYSPNFVLTSTNQLNTFDIGSMESILGRLLGMTVERDDGLFFGEAGSGQGFAQRVLPLNKIIFSRTEDDNNPRVMDFANAVVTESRVAQYASNSPLTGGDQYGPVAYWTHRDDLNPPDATAWGVMRGFPRKHVVEATAVMTVALNPTLT